MCSRKITKWTVRNEIYKYNFELYQNILWTVYNSCYQLERLFFLHFEIYVTKCFSLLNAKKNKLDRLTIQCYDKTLTLAKMAIRPHCKNSAI